MKISWMRGLCLWFFFVFGAIVIGGSIRQIIGLPVQIEWANTIGLVCIAFWLFMDWAERMLAHVNP